MIKDKVFSITDYSDAEARNWKQFMKSANRLHIPSFTDDPWTVPERDDDPPHDPVGARLGLLIVVASGFLMFGVAVLVLWLMRSL